MIGPLPRKVAIALGGAFALLAIIGAIVLMAQGGDSKDNESETLAQASTPEASPAPAATPTATPPPNRQDCNAIKGTPYTSDDEKNWFTANCASSDAPAVAAGSPGSQPSIGDRLIIAAAGVNAEVARVTVPATGQMPDPVGYFNAVWYDFSNLPGLGGYVNAGNMVLSGHVDCGKCYNGGSGTAVFWSVRNMRVGDTAQYRTADGRTIDYVVTSSVDLTPTSDFNAIVASGTADMTLITCTGTFSGGDYNLRHVVALKKKA